MIRMLKTQSQPGTGNSRRRLLSDTHQSLLLVLVVMIAGFIAQLIFQHLFYWQRFHSDSAVVSEISSAMLREGRLFPTEFQFGNDIFVLRLQFILAGLYAVGLSGFPAYALAAAINFAIALGILAAALLVWRGTPKPTALAVIFLTFLPLNFNEFDYLLGQQSHLMQTALPIAFVMLFSACVLRKPYWQACLALLLLATLVTLDSPMRGVLSVVSTLGVGFLVFPRDTKLVLPMAASLTGLVLGALLYTLVTQDVHVFGNAPRFFGISPDAVADRFGALLLDYFKLGTSLAMLEGHTLRGLTFIMVVGQIVIAISLLIYMGALLWRLVRQSVALPHEITEADGTTADQDATIWQKQTDFAGMVGVALILIGVVTILDSVFDPVTRHFLTGLVLVKFSALNLILRLYSRQSLGNWSVASGFLALIAASSLISIPLLSSSVRHKEIEMRRSLQNTIESLNSSDIISSANGNLYGNFWIVYRYAVLTDTKLNPAPIIVEGGNVVAFIFLAVPETYCDTPEGGSYFLLGPHDGAIRSAIEPEIVQEQKLGDLSLIQIQDRDIPGCPNASN